MKTSIGTTLSLCLLCVCISNSQPLSSIETCNCESWDDVCWDNCLSGGQVAESKSFPCGQIKACQKHLEKPACKDVPTTIPAQCRSTTHSVSTTPPPPDRRVESGNACACTGQTVVQNGLVSGNCNTLGTNGRYWCYVNFNGFSSCGDETRAPISGFYISYNACDIQREANFAGFYSAHASDYIPRSG